MGQGKYEALIYDCVQGKLEVLIQEMGQEKHESLIQVWVRGNRKLSFFRYGFGKQEAHIHVWVREAGGSYSGMGQGKQEAFILV